MTSPTGISSGGGLTFMVHSRCRFTAKPFVPSGPAATTTERGMATPACAQRGWVRWQRDLGGLLAPSLVGSRGWVGGNLRQEGHAATGPSRTRRTTTRRTTSQHNDNRMSAALSSDSPRPYHPRTIGLSHPPSLRSRGRSDHHSSSPWSEGRARRPPPALGASSHLEQSACCQNQTAADRLGWVIWEVNVCG